MSEDLTKKLPESDSEKLTIILTDIGELKETLHNETSEIKTETREIKRSLRDLSRKQSILNDTILQVHLDLRDMDERLLAIESTHNQQNSQT